MSQYFKVYYKARITNTVKYWYKRCIWAAETAQRLLTFAVLPENQSLISSVHMAADNQS